MGRPHLIIVCGVPGSGKSTFALHMADRFGAVSFATETFAEELGAAARTASGDLSKAAILHAYAAMANAVSDALTMNRLIVAVGSFRSKEQRGRFREIARNAGADVMAIRIACSVKTAANRVCARRAVGERGPDEKAIYQIDSELNCSNDIDMVLANECSVEEFRHRIDDFMQLLEGARLGTPRLCRRHKDEDNK